MQRAFLDRGLLAVREKEIATSLIDVHRPLSLTGRSPSGFDLLLRTASTEYAIMLDVEELDDRKQQVGSVSVAIALGSNDMNVSYRKECTAEEAVQPLVALSNTLEALALIQAGIEMLSIPDED